MSTLDGTLINQQLTEMRDNLTQAAEEKEGLAQALIDRGATNLATTSRIATIGKAAIDLIDSLERSELTSAIRIHINPVGSDGFVPGDTNIADILAGAHLRIEEAGTANVWRVPITSIDNASYSFENTFTKATTTIVVSVVLGKSSIDIRSRRVSAVIAQGTNVDLTVTTYLSDEDAFEVGRVFPVDENDASSYLITATTANGKRVEHFGKFDASGVWISDTGLTSSVPEIDPDTGTVASWANGPDNGDSFANLWPWNAVKRETFTAIDATGEETELVMSGFRRDAFYGVRFEEREMIFSTLNVDGTTTSTTKLCRILWIARPHLDGYEIPSFFYQKAYEDNGEGGLALRMTLAKGLFWGAHKGNTKSIKASSSESVTILTTGTIGSTNTGVSVANFNAYARALNRVSLRDPIGAVYGADATNRRWAATNLDTYMAWWHLFVVQFGLDAQTVFQGITTDAGGVAQSKCGVTDIVVNAGHMTGSVGSAAGFTPFVFLGIENFGYSSEGDALCDVSFFSGRETDADALETRTYVQPDRARYNPGQGDIPTLTAQGYQLLTTRDNGNSVSHFCGRSDNPALRDMHMPTRADDGFLNAKKCDQSGGIYRTGAGTGNWTLSAACCFGFRSAGHAGGARAGVCALGWCNAGGGPSDSGASGFGARVSLLLAD